MKRQLKRALDYFLYVKPGKFSIPFLTRIRLITLYFILFLSIVAGSINLFFVIDVGRLYPIITVALFIALELASFIYFLVKRDLEKAQLIAIVGIIIMITELILDAGGYYGLGALYFVACFSAFYLILDLRMGIIIPLYFFFGMMIRLYLGGFYPTSIFNNPEIVRRFTLVLGVGSALGILSSYSLELFTRYLTSLAFSNPITKMPNRFKLKSHLDEYVKSYHDEGETFSVVGFKILNFNRLRGNLGNESGDEIIRQISSRLMGIVPPATIIAHWSNTIFMLLIKEHDDSLVKHQIKPIQEALTQAYDVENGRSYIQLVTAVSQYPKDSSDSSKLIENVLALLDKQDMHTGSVLFYSNEYLKKEEERFRLISALNRAEMDREFHLVYQPKIDLNRRACVGAEVLLRWTSQELGEVSPEVFIPLAEEIGLIHKITCWVVQTSFREINLINSVASNSENKLVHAINLSIADLKHLNFASFVEKELKDSGCQSDQIELELTESLVMEDDPRIKMNLNALKELGFSLAIDDFGTGYSSLSYLHKLQVHNLKIDKSFTSQIDGSSSSNATSIIDAIISLGISLNLTLTAEGIETVEQSNYLKSKGCHTVQGWLYSKGLRVEEYIQYLRQTGAIS